MTPIHHPRCTRNTHTHIYTRAASRQNPLPKTFSEVSDAWGVSTSPSRVRSWWKHVYMKYICMLHVANIRDVYARKHMNIYMHIGTRACHAAFSSIFWSCYLDSKWNDVLSRRLWMTMKGACPHVMLQWDIKDPNVDKLHTKYAHMKERQCKLIYLEDTY